MKYEKYKDLYTQFLISEKNLSRNSVNNYLVDLDQFFFILKIQKLAILMLRLNHILLI